MLNPSTLELAKLAFNTLSREIYEANVKKGWYRDPRTGRKISRNIPEMLALLHSEISEALEGLRKNLRDDHLPDFDMFVVELADVLIRLFDTAGYYQHKKAEGQITTGGKDNLGEAFVEKILYNGRREDHLLHNRAQANGKKI